MLYDVCTLSAISYNITRVERATHIEEGAGMRTVFLKNGDEIADYVGNVVTIFGKRSDSGFSAVSIAQAREIVGDYDGERDERVD